MARPPSERRLVAAALRGGPRCRRAHRADERRVVPDCRGDAGVVRAAGVGAILPAGGAVGSARLRRLAQLRVSELPAPEGARPDRRGSERDAGPSGAQHDPRAACCLLSVRLPARRHGSRATAGRDCRPGTARPLRATRRSRTGAAHRVRERRESPPRKGHESLARDGGPECAWRRARPPHPAGADRERRR